MAARRNRRAAFLSPDSSGCSRHRTQVRVVIFHMAASESDTLRRMLKRRRSIALLAVGLFGLTGFATASDDADLLPVWKRGDGEAHVRLSKPKTLPQGLVSVSYHLLAVNTALATPEMVVAKFGVVCASKTGAPVQLVHSHTTMFKFVRGNFVQDSDEPVSPPMDVSLDTHHDFAAMPATVACARAVAMVKSRS